MTVMMLPFVPTLTCRNRRYQVSDPSRGTAPGVVEDTIDKEIAGKPELLKLHRWANRVGH